MIDHPAYQPASWPAKLPKLPNLPSANQTHLITLHKKLQSPSNLSANLQF